jgi:hypothetical protein
MSQPGRGHHAIGHSGDNRRNRGKQRLVHLARNGDLVLVDSNSLVSASCPASTTSAQQGTAVVIKASCTDSAGNSGTGSVTAAIDTTPPKVTISAVKNGAVYLIGQVP